MPFTTQFLLFSRPPEEIKLSSPFLRLASTTLRCRVVEIFEVVVVSLLKFLCVSRDLKFVLEHLKHNVPYF